MAMKETRPWDWKRVTHENDAEHLARLIRHIPADGLISRLEWARRRRWDTYPIVLCWRCAIAEALMGHATTSSFLRDLGSRPDIQACLVPRRLQAGARLPNVDAMTTLRRKLLVLLTDGTLQGISDRMLRALRRHIPGLGDQVGVVSVPLMLEPRSLRRVKEGQWEPANGLEITATCPFPGQDYRVVTPWFGFCLHVLIDVRHEIPLAWILVPGHTDLAVPKDHMGAEFARRHPDWKLGEIKDVGTIRIPQGGDEYLWTIKMLNSVRVAREGEVAVVPRELSNVRREDHGVYCYARSSLADAIIRRRMVFTGTDKAKRSGNVTEKWRCPAAACGFDCMERLRCRGSAFGRVVRVRSDRPHALPGESEDLGAADRFRRRVLHRLGFSDFRTWDYIRAALRIELAMMVLREATSRRRRKR